MQKTRLVRGGNKACELVSRCQKHYPRFKVVTFADFARKVGIPLNIYNSWQRYGIRQIYYTILDYLDLIDELEGRISELTKQNKKLKELIS